MQATDPHPRAFELGVCYYPEHWPEKLWADDFKRMRDAGLSVVRMGEFAWSIFEPEEGRYDFALFDRALAAADKAGIKVILGTPTATPPAWLTSRHPEVLNADAQGHPYQHGQRRHYNYSSPVYLEYCARITRAMADHFGRHPAVIGWQIDNELNCEIDVFYSTADHDAFRAWLQRRYGTLEELNAAWGAVFWNQTYTDWAQVRLPGPTPSASPNPHQVLDQKRFISDQTVALAAAQARIVRERSPGRWITTNGLFGHLDYQALVRQGLDFISYDSYPQFGRLWPDAGPDPLLDRRSSLALTRTRSISPLFTVMEQQSGAGGWVNKMAMPSPEPGQMRLWTYQSIAHGADRVLYFRWRTAPFGTEIYWHGLNEPDNHPNRRITELTRIGAELGRVGAEIVGRPAQADVALVRDYDNEWDGEFDVWHGPLREQSTASWFKALQFRHVPLDLVDLRDDTDPAALQRYRVLVYPHASILTPARAALLTRYVEQGGTLIFGARTGYKDLRGHRPMADIPGPVASLCGIRVDDFTRLAEGATGTALDWKGAPAGEAASLTAEKFNDVLEVTAPDVEVRAAYSGSYYKGRPALTVRRAGAGRVWYFGAVFTPAVADRLAAETGMRSPLDGWCEAPKEVEAVVRGRGADRVVFLLNYSSQPAEVRLKHPAKELLTGHTWNGGQRLESYGVALLRPGE